MFSMVPTAEHPFDNEQLTTARLTLRRPAAVDVGTILGIHSDPKACAHNPSDMLATRADAEERFRMWDEHWNRHGFGYWVIRRRDGQALQGGQAPQDGQAAPGLGLRAPRDGQAAPSLGVGLGFCGLKLMRLNDTAVLNLFYRLAPSAWGDGVAGEAATAVVAWATEHAPELPVIARVRPDNIASARVAVRAGLHRAPHLDTRGEDGLDLIYITNGSS